MLSFDASDFGLYYEQDFRYRWLRPAHWYDKLKKYQTHHALVWEMLGLSEEGREIWNFKWGEGAVNIALWTQMHGNESTATMACVDLLNFLIDEKLYIDVREKLRASTTLNGIIMLNPDGADAYERRNAFGIDLNRDAVTRVSAEINIFYTWLEKVGPDWCFNLHDQRNFYRPQGIPQPATISFLAPSPDFDRSISSARQKSMDLISCIYTRLKPEIGEASRYSDEYYPTALGDNLMRLGIPTVLIESGAAVDDPYRDKARKYCFLALINAFIEISAGGETGNNENIYQNIPLNDTKMLDILIQDVTINSGARNFKSDVGLLIKEVPNIQNGNLEINYQITEFGDLKAFSGMKTLRGGILNSGKHLNINQAAEFNWEGENEKFVFKKGKLL